MLLVQAMMTLLMVDLLIFKMEGRMMKKVFLFFAAFAALASCVKEAPITGSNNRGSSSRNKDSACRRNKR